MNYREQRIYTAGDIFADAPRPRVDTRTAFEKKVDAEFRAQMEDEVKAWGENHVHYRADRTTNYWRAKAEWVATSVKIEQALGRW